MSNDCQHAPVMVIQAQWWSCGAIRTIYVQRLPIGPNYGHSGPMMVNKAQLGWFMSNDCQQDLIMAIQAQWWSCGAIRTFYVQRLPTWPNYGHSGPMMVNTAQKMVYVQRLPTGPNYDHSDPMIFMPSNKDDLCPTTANRSQLWSFRPNDGQ
jgi:hypothetical protein